MAKKASKSTTKSVDLSQLRICFERILPEEMGLERRATMGEMVTTVAPELSADVVEHISRMALPISKKWANTTTLNCRFLDGTPKMKKKVEGLAHKWEKHADIKFKFVTSGPAEIRISFFADSGSWSAVGRDALNSTYFPLHQPTMNYGWLRDDTEDDEYSRVVLHEFGHALGCIHEHQSPTFDRKWNRAAVLQAFQGSPNFWSPADIEHNVLQKYSPTGMAATKFDPDSIMLYAFDGSLFSDGGGDTNSNKKLSSTDVSMIKQMYP